MKLNLRRFAVPAGDPEAKAGLPSARRSLEDDEAAFLQDLGDVVLREAREQALQHTDSPLRPALRDGTCQAHSMLVKEEVEQILDDFATGLIAYGTGCVDHAPIRSHRGFDARPVAHVGLGHARLEFREVRLHPEPTLTIGAAPEAAAYGRVGSGYGNQSRNLLSRHTAQRRFLVSPGNQTKLVP